MTEIISSATQTVPDGPAWPRRLAVTLLFLALAVGHTWPYFGGLDATSRVRDWVVYQSAAECTRRSLLEYHQLPEWDPWRCGGTPHAAEPGVDLFSPWTLLTLTVGVSPAIRASAVGHVFLALVSMWWWARRRGLGVVPALGAACAFGLSGYFAAAIAWGLAPLLAAAYLPLLMVAFEAGRERWRGAVGMGAVLALCLAEGAPGVALLGVWLLGVRAFYDLFSRGRRGLRSLAAVALALAVAAGLAAPKLWPTLLLLAERPLPLPRADTLLLTQLIDIFVSRNPAHWASGFTFERYEYFNYVGPLVFGCALWGLWRVRDTPYKELYTLAAGVLLLMLGDQGTWMPYHWLTQVPLLRWLLAVPSRLSVGLSLIGALVFAHAMSALEWGFVRRRFGRRWRFVTLLPVLLMAADLIVVCRGQWRAHPFTHDAEPAEPAPFSLISGDRGAQYQALMHNQGVLACHQPLPFQVAAGLRAGPGPQVWLQDHKAGSVQLERFSPNRLQLDLALQRDAVVLFNQGYHRGWSARGEIGARVVAVEGQLALQAQRGSGRVELRFVTPGLRPGLVAAGVTLLLLLAAAVVAALRRRAETTPYA